MELAGVAVGLVCALTWACGSILTRDLARKLDPFTLNAPRMTVGGLAMLAATLATGRQSGYALLTSERLLYLIGSMIIGGGLGDALYVTSMARIGVCRSFPIANAYPALTLIIGVLFLHEAVSTPMVVGLCMVTGGIYLVGRPSQDPVATAPKSEGTSGVAMAVMAAVCWAGSMVMVAPGLQGLDPIMVASVRTSALALILWGIVAARRTWSRLAALSRREWVVIVVGGLVAWGLGSVLFLLTVSVAGPTRAAILTATSPLFALPLGLAFLRERANPIILAGTALTVLGVVLVTQN